MSTKYENFDTEKFITKIGQMSRENQIKIGIMINTYEPKENEMKREILREYADGLRFKLGDLNEELLDKLINFVERV